MPERPQPKAINDITTVIKKGDTRIMSQNTNGDDGQTTGFIPATGLTEAQVAHRIEADIAASQRDGCPITLDTARLIAASIHRGLGSELEQFAATGIIPTNKAYQVLRLELNLTAKGEPQIVGWATALQEFLSCYTDCRHNHPAGKQSGKWRSVARKDPWRKGCR